MTFTDFKSLSEVMDAFPTEESCIIFLESQRWHANVKSPFDSESKVWKCKNHKYMCKNTGKYFNVKTDTFLENTNIPLRKWMLAIWLVVTNKKGLSSLQLSRDLNVAKKTALYMSHKIRLGFAPLSDDKIDGIVEADETFVGGKNKNRHKDKKVPQSQGRSFKDKTPVLGLLQRNGNLKAFVVPDTKASTLQPIIRKHVEKGSIFISDEWLGYNHLHSDYKHHIVDHAKKQYVDFDNPEIHSNSIEGFWSILKRGYNGIYNWWSRKHLQKYVDEFVFRYNVRKLNDGDKFLAFFSNFASRFTIRQLIAT
jgi:transposase-like protein